MTSLRALQTLIFYTACIVGRRLVQIDTWWRGNGKPDRKFTTWLKKNLIGHDLGRLSEDEIYRYICIAKIQALYPKIIFISTASWSAISRNVSAFTNFITRTERQRLFWSSVDVQLNFRVGNSTVITGPVIQHEGCGDMPTIDFDVDQYQQLIDDRDRREEQRRLGHLTMELELEELGDDCDIQDGEFQ